MPRSSSAPVSPSGTRPPTRSSSNRPSSDQGAITVNLNATLFAQLVVFLILAVFTMKFVWPPIMKALDERAKKIADGLSAADKAKSELALTEKRVGGEMRTAGARAHRA